MKSLRIGIDAKWFFEGPPSGRVVVSELVKHMLSIGQAHQFIIFLDRDFRGRTFPHTGHNVELVYVWARNNLLANLFILPFYCIKLKIDACVFQNFGTFTGFARRLVFIHDTIFISNPEHFTLLERLYFSPMKYLARISERIITVSQNEKRRMKLYSFVHADKIDIVYNGVSDHFFKKSESVDSQFNIVKKKYGIPNDYLLYVGRLNARKNLLNLLKSVTQMQSRLPLVLVGSVDWKMFNLSQVLFELGISSRVFVLGFVDEVDLPVLFHNAKVFCYISYDEGFGLPPLEAMACGLPVVVSDIPIFNEVLGSAANYVDADDPKSVARKIDELLSNQSLYNDKSESGIMRARMYSWSESAKSLLEIVERTVQTSGSFYD
ncbi:MAG: glycosyltransferase family 4 protein [Bacteroidetes bacterium]|nr:glycosyltransferase family 4 protein [Bacteroidota bacterium]